MPVIPRDLRTRLESVIREARSLAVAGARKALVPLDVAKERPSESLTEAQRLLRKRLRAHARQLGDPADRVTGTQSVDRLVQEIAYEHWHRMLFARFLAENGLLIEPEHCVPVTMEFCEELALEKGTDPWALAASFAQRMLPRIFRTEDPALAVELSAESRQALQKLLAGLPPETFTADDSLGWTYQFWQSSEKDAVNARVKSGEKITGATLPAVTQLFTEPYMVQFLLHNTIGAWHAGKVLAERPDLAASAEDEATLRDAVRLPLGDGYRFDYLRFVRDPRNWRPAAGTYEGWPRRAAELRVLDPCCGSGHFLVAAFELLVALRQNEEKLSVEEAIHAVLKDNIFGLELDPRCTQIAAFHLALAAWRLAKKPIDLPPLRIACSGLGPQATRDEWLELADQNSAAWEGIEPKQREAIRKGLGMLHETFSKAPDLGSLIDPAERPQDLFTASYEQLRPFLEAAYAAEADDEQGQERAVAARGMAEAAQILAGPHGSPKTPYTLVITNVPYLGRKNHSEDFKAWVDAHYRDARADLATVFLDRMLRWVKAGSGQGTVAAVTPQNWLFLTGYRKLRERLLKCEAWNLISRLGAKAFQTPMWDFNVALVLLSGNAPPPNWALGGIDVMVARVASEKAALLRGEPVAESVIEMGAVVAEANPAESLDESDETEGEEPPPPAERADGSVKLLRQADQLMNPDARIILSKAHKERLLAEFADSYQGIGTSDNFQFLFQYWEFSALSSDYRFVQVAPKRSTLISGCSTVLCWEGGSGRYFRHAMGLKADGRLGGWKSGGEAWTRNGLAVSVTGRPVVACYLGEMFDTTLAAVIPKLAKDLPVIAACLEDPSFERRAREVDQALSLTEHSLLKVPFDPVHWRSVAAEKYPNGLPDPQSDDPTQWLFHGHPAHAEQASALQVAVARLLGYRWPAELDPKMKLAPEARAKVESCEALLPLADDEGVVCLPSIRGKGPAVDRLRALFAHSFRSNPGGWSAALERDLLAAAAAAHGGGKPSESLDDWLRDHFFEEHCSLFQGRPFVWHVWDGRRDGFQALVSYHKLAGPDGLGRRTLETLTYTYLGEWIEKQRSEQKDEVEGAQGRLAAATELQAKLKRIIDGDPPCDLFVRWKALHEQAIGWDPDINDGVRLNLRPFLMAGDVKAKGAGVLLSKPDNTWSNKKKLGVADRGKEPESLRPKGDFPWFWGCNPETNPEHRTDFGADVPGAVPPGAFEGVRWNGLHYSRAAKEAARKRSRRGKA